MLIGKQGPEACPPQSFLPLSRRPRRTRTRCHPAPQQNFDPRNELVVANEQFARVLSAQGLLPTDARLRELLTRRYAVSDFRRQTTVHQVRTYVRAASEMFASRCWLIYMGRIMDVGVS